MVKKSAQRPIKKIQFGVLAFSGYASDTINLLQKGFESRGYELFARGASGKYNNHNVRSVCEKEKPDIVFFQAPNQWRPDLPQSINKHVGFINYKWLAQDKNIVKITQYCDPCSHQNVHQEWQLNELVPDMVLCRYDLDNVIGFNPWINKSTLFRAYHSVTREYCLPVVPRDKVAILAGALQRKIYPMRTRLYHEIVDRGDPWIFTIRRHHKYSRTSGSAVPGFMQALSEHRVSVVCTSDYRWALKKHFEATAAGCIVVTNLPESEKIPIIEENLVRVRSEIPVDELSYIVQSLARSWDLEKQRDLARRTIDRYDYRREAKRIDLAAKKLMWNRKLNL